jgi:hypothetical protein
MNPEPPEYEAGVLTTRPRSWVIFLERLRKPTRNLSQANRSLGRGLNSELPEYEAGGGGNVRGIGVMKGKDIY